MMDGVAARLDPYLGDLHRAWLADEDAAAWRELDASLLFFAISGFTPLTERLAKRGKGGVELLVELLREVGRRAAREALAAHEGDLDALR